MTYINTKTKTSSFHWSKLFFIKSTICQIHFVLKTLADTWKENLTCSNFANKSRPSPSNLWTKINTEIQFWCVKRWWKIKVSEHREFLYSAGGNSKKSVSCQSACANARCCPQHIMTSCLTGVCHTAFMMTHPVRPLTKYRKSANTRRKQTNQQVSKNKKSSITSYCSPTNKGVQ